jgi:hypothetical protein
MRGRFTPENTNRHTLPRAGKGNGGRRLLSHDEQAPEDYEQVLIPLLLTFAYTPETKTDT